MEYFDCSIGEDEVSYRFDRIEEDDMHIDKEDHQENIIYDVDDNSDHEISEGKENEEEDTEKPYEGMKFESEEQAIDFYNKYAKKVGFGVRKGSTRKSLKDGSTIGRCLYCNKQGFREEKYKKDAASKKRKRGETRVGCEARLFVNKTDDGMWVVSVFDDNHNHKCATPRKSHLFSSHRRVDKNRGALIDKMKEAGIRTNLMMHYFSEEARGSHNVGFTERDMRNHLRSKRMEIFQKGDAQCLLDYLNDKQTENPHFFYAIQLDAEGHMTNFFWADAKCRIDYNYFGDVVCIDATYGTNAYAKPFIPIVGVNNHLQTVLFGCALMLDETQSSFEWVLKKWIQAMNGIHPKIIFTDQDSALTGAIASVLPNTRHRFCLWHIFQNVKKHLGYLFRRGSKFGEEFSSCIRKFETEEHFERGWDNLLTMYDLHQNEWVSKLYSKREKWVPVYSRAFFCADMSTTQRSESINKFFKGFLNRNLLLLDFVKGVDKALLRRREAEREADFHMNNILPTLIVHSPVEEMASKIYTPPLFQEFQEELIGSLRYTSEKISDDGFTATYTCKAAGHENQCRTIKFRSIDQVVQCSCSKFEFSGILCRHILRVFIAENIFHIPEKYVLKRWSRNAKDECVVDERGEQLHADCQAPLTLRYSILCNEAIEVAAEGVSSIEAFEVARQGFRRTMREVQAAKKKENNDITKGCPISGNSIDKQAGMSTIKEPLVGRSKGRPGRYKAFWEKKNKKNQKEKISTSTSQQKTTKKKTGTQCYSSQQSNHGFFELPNHASAEKMDQTINCNFHEISSPDLCQPLIRDHQILPISQDLTTQFNHQDPSYEKASSTYHIPVNNNNNG